MTKSWENLEKGEKLGALYIKTLLIRGKTLNGENYIYIYM